MFSFLFALKTIRSHGPNGNALWGITRATVVTLLHASPAWWGYVKADESSRLQSIIVKAVRYGYLPCSFSSTLDELREDCDENCFSQLGTTLTMSSTAFCLSLKY